MRRSISNFWSTWLKIVNNCGVISPLIVAVFCAFGTGLMVYGVCNYSNDVVMAVPEGYQQGSGPDRMAELYAMDALLTAQNMRNEVNQTFAKQQVVEEELRKKLSDLKGQLAKLEKRQMKVPVATASLRSKLGKGQLVTIVTTDNAYLTHLDEAKK